MIITLDYNKLMDILGEVSVVVEDKFLDNNMKNFIFRTTGADKLEVITFSSKAHEIKPVENEFFNLELTNEDSSDTNFIQVNAKDFLNALNSYKSLNLSVPKSVKLSTIKAKVRVTVLEEFIAEDEGGNHKTQESVWVFDNVPVKEAILKQIDYAFNADVEPEDIDPAHMMLYLTTLMPLLADEAGNTLPSRLNFSDDYVFAVPNAFVTLFKNQLPPCFRGITLGYSLLNVLRKSIQNCSSFKVSRDDIYLLIEIDETKIFLRYDVKVPKTDIYLRKLDKNHAIVVNRLYIKDVLKRLSLSKDNTKMKIDVEAGVLQVNNGKFNQDVPLLTTKNLDAIGSIEFSLDTTVAMKAIVGDDSVFTQQDDGLRMYISKVGTTGYMLCFCDATDAWYSIVQVR